MRRIVFLLEEFSSKEFLKQLMPRITNEIESIFISFDGKSDLEESITRKLRAFNTEDTFFIILRDQDNGECLEIKNRIKQKCYAANKSDAYVRIACRELESWYFGDLKTVESVLNISGLNKKYGRTKLYRIPDEIVNPKRELKKITNNKYKEIASSREIGRCIDYNNNKSNSFNLLMSTIRDIANK